jgi:hypothetical protein
VEQGVWQRCQAPCAFWGADRTDAEPPGSCAGEALDALRPESLTMP